MRRVAYDVEVYCWTIGYKGRYMLAARNRRHDSYQFPHSAFPEQLSIHQLNYASPCDANQPEGNAQMSLSPGVCRR